MALEKPIHTPKKPHSRISIKTVRQLAHIMDTFKLDTLETDGLKLTRSQHLFTEAELRKAGLAQPLRSGTSNDYPPTTIEELDAQLGIN